MGAWHYEIEPQFFRGGRIIHTDGESVDRFWQYDLFEVAFSALARWAASGYEGEPEGWVRARTGEGAGFRRRPGGRREEEFRGE